MIQIEERYINNIKFRYTYSDIHHYIERDGFLYEEAYDPWDLSRTYIETDIPIEDPEDESDEENEYAEAGKILMGVAE